MSEEIKASPETFILKRCKDAPEKKADVAKWLAKWRAPAAVAYRNEIGRFRDENGDWFSGFELIFDGRKQDAFLLHLFHFQCYQLACENVLPQFLEQPTPKHRFFALKAMGKAGEHMLALSQMAAQNRTPEFFMAVAEALEQISKTSDLDPSKKWNRGDYAKILRAFQILCEQHGELPNKKDLEVAAFGNASPKGSQRDAFNKRLRHLGLDGLPKRTTEKRKAGPVRINPPRSQIKKRRR